ncbi:MAG: ABC transporter substrate-binding protein [Bacillota bacterium]
MTRKRSAAFILVLIMLLTSLTFTGCSIGKPKTIKIAVAGPMQFIQGQHHWLGAQMAADEINAAGGVNVGGKKYQIELVKVDTNELLSVDDATSAVEKAITTDKVNLIVGTIRSEAAVAIQELAADNKTMLIVCGASLPQMAEKVGKDYNRYKYWFRVTPINATLLVKSSMLLLNQVGAIERKEFGIAKPKVAAIIEKAVAGDPLAAAAAALIPTFGMEFVGVWRPSPTATDLTAELTAIRKSGAQIIYTYFSATAGVPYAKQWAELQIPAASVGINVEAQSKGFMEATGGKGNYEFTLNTYAPVEITPKTIPFYTKFTEKAGQFPTYNAGTYDAIYIWKEAVERAASLENDKIVPEMEKTAYQSGAGKVVFDKKHDVTWGPGYVTALGTQWQDGKLVAVWPDGWQGIKYKGTVDYKLPPWVIAAWKKK